MRPRAERELTPDIARDVAHLGVGTELALVPVRRSVEEQHLAAPRDGPAVDLDGSGGGARQTLYRCRQSQELLDGTTDAAGGVPEQDRALLRVARQ